MLLHCAMAFVLDVFGFRSGCGLVTCLRCKDTNPKIATYALTYVSWSSVRLYAIFFSVGKYTFGFFLALDGICVSCRFVILAYFRWQAKGF